MNTQPFRTDATPPSETGPQVGKDADCGPSPLGKLYDAMASHDWHWYATDDCRVYERGRIEEANLDFAARCIPGGLDLLIRWRLCIHRGQPKPQRPA